MNPPSSKLRTPICIRERRLLVCDVAERRGELEGSENKRKRKKVNFIYLPLIF